MEDGNLRELQEEVEMLKARLAELENRPAARLRKLVARLGSRRRVRFALMVAAVVVATASYAAVPYTFTNGTIADADEVNANFDDLDSRVAALEEKTECMTQVGDEVYFTSCNVNVRSGSGATDGAVNGLGNLIVGYNENGVSATRTGSHNLVVGIDHEYTSYAGLVAGYRNTVTGAASSISGGSDSTASGDYSSVSGGYHNWALGDRASVNGGQWNGVNGSYSSVSGGAYNQTAPFCSSCSVSGGYDNTASEDYSSVSGGQSNTASGLFSSISGGRYASASGDYSSVSGGRWNEAGGEASSVSGGNSRSADGQDDWAAGTLWEDN